MRDRGGHAIGRITNINNSVMRKSSLQMYSYLMADMHESSVVQSNVLTNSYRNINQRV